MKKYNQKVPTVCSICKEVFYPSIQSLNASRRNKIHKNKPFLYHCRLCCKKGILNPNYKNGKKIIDGYIYVRKTFIDQKYQPFFSHLKDIYIAEHRLKMSIKLNRKLETWEHVHHLNSNPLDNNIENLYLTDSATHFEITKLNNEIVQLRKENEKLKLIKT